MNRRERVLKTLELEEPDRVPIGELGVDADIIAEVTGRGFSGTTSRQSAVLADRQLDGERVGQEVEFYEKIGFDLYLALPSTPEGWEPEKNPDGTIVDLWGRVMKLDEVRNQWVPYSTIFDSPEDFEDFELPDSSDPGWTYSLRYAKELIGTDMAVAGRVRDPFAHAWELFTPINFVRWMRRDPGFIEGVIDEIADFNAGLIGQMGEAGADLVISGGDYCEEKGPMVPTEFFEETIFPALEKQVRAAHDQGLKFIKHTDGNVVPLLEGMAEIVDGVHSLDPSAGVDIGEVKEKYGDRVALMGNISVDHLAEKTKSEIVKETRECIRRASPGGGHILSSSNTWAAGAKLENCLAMVDTGREYGRYPIGT